MDRSEIVAQVLKDPHAPQGQLQDSLEVALYVALCLTPANLKDEKNRYLIASVVKDLGFNGECPLDFSRYLQDLVSSGALILAGGESSQYYIRAFDAKLVEGKVSQQNGESIIFDDNTAYKVIDAVRFITMRGDEVEAYLSPLHQKAYVKEIKKARDKVIGFITLNRAVREYLSFGYFSEKCLPLSSFLSHTQCDDRDRKREEIKETAGRIEELEARAQESELIRRRLHNTFQELRGNLRVIARVRPPILSDRINGRSPAVWVEGDATVCVKYKEKTSRFTYDGAFGTDSTQEEVFDEVSNFVQSALDGYDVCLFTYGQTGSGKTYTMQGVGDEAARGIVPRSIEKIMAAYDRTHGEFELDGARVLWGSVDHGIVVEYDSEASARGGDAKE